MKTNFLENNHVVHCVPAANSAAAEDWGDTAVNSDVISLANADGAVFILTTTNNAGGASSIFICAADDTTPTTTVAVSFRYKYWSSPDTLLGSGESAEFLTSTGADIVYVFEVDASKVAEQGYKYVVMSAPEATNAAVDGTMMAFLTGLRYKEDDAGSQVT